MADELKVLGQSKPAATTLTALYTVPGGKQAAISTIACCNRHTTDPGSIRISIAIAGAADAASQYLYYDLPTRLNDTQGFTIGITLGAGDVVRVYSSHGEHVFQAFGAEVTP